MNVRMSELLKRANASATSVELSRSAAPPLIVVGDSVFLKDEYEKSRHVKQTDFSDRTGYESFINHVHLPYDGSREFLLSCLSNAFAIRTALCAFENSRHFLVIVSIFSNDCVIRFHQLRPRESWLADDLDSYKEEAILTLSTAEVQDTNGTLLPFSG